MATTNLSIRMDTETKKQAEQLFGNLGMSISTAFNIFVKQSLRVRGIPFSITENIPDSEAFAALREAREIARDPKIKGYTDVEEALRDLKA
ncbi:MAG: type II toxin-antitoxin system RelB/DinJ family antitoxin [Lentisphaeria bacterium]|nr:type II toxin-antitoxin system RelB/DinJ family antitoxin [Lentisphaeria bacterium]